jgi:TatD DNase family protein
VNPFLIDIHTHQILNSEEVLSIPSIFLQDIDFHDGIDFPFTSAIHPWHATLFSSEEIDLMLLKLAEYPRLIAVGETGLDKACNVDYQFQKRVFEQHIEFAENQHKPLIIHAVKSWNEIIFYIRKIKVPVILHAYTAGPEITRQLIDLGCNFSLGKAVLNLSSHLQESLKLIPDDSLFLETDNSSLSIIEIYDQVSKLFDRSLNELKNQINQNYRRVFINQV